jgi:cation diffusion facilitator family transporter
MHTHRLDDWIHDHVFDQQEKRAGENRTLLIVVITAIMMVVEIAAGLIYGSMALLADGLHMGSHASALGIAVFAYVISRRLAADSRFSFGVGKINSLAGFASALLLLGFAVLMIVESAGRFLNPVTIAFEQALIVAILGLFVNGASAWVLVSTPQDHAHAHSHDHQHGHGHDHNLRAAYLHVLADAVTSLLAIFALLAGKYFGASWLDPVMGIVGGILVARWSYGLIRETSRILLDTQASADQVSLIQQSIEAGSTDRVSDLHVWSIGHGIYAAEIAVISDDPQSPNHYKSLIPPELSVVHVTIEVHQCENH